MPLYLYLYTLSPLLLLSEVAEEVMEYGRDFGDFFLALFPIVFLALLQPLVAFEAHGIEGIAHQLAVTVGDPLADCA